MAAPRNRFVTEALENCVQVRVKSPGEIAPEPAASISILGESQPVLLHLRKSKPRFDQTIFQCSSSSFIAQKPKVSNHPFMEYFVLGSLAIKEQERVNEEWQIVYNGDIERTVGLQVVGIHFENIAEIDVDVRCLIVNHWGGLHEWQLQLIR